MHALIISDPHHEGLTEGDYDDLMTICFYLDLIRKKKINIDSLVVYLVNNNPERFIQHYPELNCSEISFISKESEKLDQIVQNSQFIGIMAPLCSSKDEEIINSILNYPKDIYSQGFPIPPEGMPRSYNFSKMDEETKKQMDKLIKTKYGDSTKVEIDELREFMPERYIEFVKKFVISRYLFMPNIPNVAPGLVSERYGRGNNYRGLLKILGQCINRDLIGEYESMPDKEQRIEWAKRFVEGRTLNSMISSYYHNFIQKFASYKNSFGVECSFIDNNEEFLDGLKVLSWVYELIVVTQFEEMPSIAYGFGFVIRDNLFTLESPFSYDYSTTKRVLNEWELIV